MKLLALTKAEDRCFFKLEKKQSFFKNFRNFLTELNFASVDIENFGYELDEECLPTSKEKDISKLIDKHGFFKNDDYNIDIISGKNSIFVIISTKSDKQKELSEKILKFADFDKKVVKK